MSEKDGSPEGQDGVWPLKWSIPFWLLAAAASWAALIYGPHALIDLVDGE